MCFLLRIRRSGYDEELTVFQAQGTIGKGRAVGKSAQQHRAYI